MESFINYICDVYGFEITPCSIPKSQFQYFKRDFYLFVKNKISEKLFYFLRDKISPIKYLEKRPDDDVLLHKRIDGKLIYEIVVSDFSKLKTPNIGKIYICKSDGSYKIFGVDLNSGISKINYEFSSFSELNSILRDLKLKEILNN